VGVLGTRAFTWAAAGLAILYCVTAIFVFRNIAHSGGWWPDDAIYRFQGKCLAIGRSWVPVPPEPEAFRVPGVTRYEDRMFGKYYPGFPMILAGGERLGAPSIVNPLLGAVSIFATFLLGRQIASPAIGLAAAFLLAASPLHAALSIGYLSHQTSIACSLLAAFSILRARREKSMGWAMLGGFLAGWCAATRPFTLVLLAVPVAALAVHDLATRGRREALAWTLPFAAGALPWAVAILLWNASLTGAPMRSAYEVSNPPDGLGFVETLPTERGGLGLYTPAQAVESTLAQLRSAAAWLLPFRLRGAAGLALLLPLAALPFLPSVRRRGLALAVPAAALIAGHFFYPGSRGVAATGLGPRYYAEGVPFYFISAALVAGAALARTRSFARLIAWGALAAGVALVAMNLNLVAGYARTRFENPVTSQSELLADWLNDLEPERRLVFVDISTYDDASTLLVNRADLTNDNLVAVYRYPEQNQAVIDAFPGRARYLLRWDSQISSADMRVYDVAADSTGPPRVFPYNQKRYSRTPPALPTSESVP
jgi:hypothetical protein